ncbi:type 1 glutamine amidotransferase domain-containing protein [Aquimarina sp. 2-A2]|uniref:type 1 glutamine amidotransferase domain-containing protein n=1 Tax=Aquimarina sp. 2-A2 TaxID=3382644 RepID=UPI00387F190A
MKRYHILLLTLLSVAACKEPVIRGQASPSSRVLFVTSNQHTYGNTKQNTANHFGEIVIAYDVLRKAGYDIDFVSPEGGAIPVGYLKTSDSIQKKYLYDTNFMSLLKHTLKPEDITASEYKAIYYSGGGAAMFGVPENKLLQDIAAQIYENNGVVSAICHGTAGIVHIKDKKGQYIYYGKHVNGFPDKFENPKAPYYQEFPFSIENKIRENGGVYTSSEKGWDNFFVVDGRLITGQDPSATASVANEIIKKIENKHH